MAAPRLTQLTLGDIMSVTNDKLMAAKAFINTWLKDPKKYCACCTKTYENGKRCCNDPYIVDNMKRTMDFCQALKEHKDALDNEFGSSHSKNMRFSISMPAELMRALQRYFGENYGEDFLVEKKEGRRFMKMFPQFTACERI